MEQKAPQLTSGIEVSADGSITCTGDGVNTYRILAIYNALALNCLTGLNPTRGVNIQSYVKKAYGLKGNKFNLFQQLGLKLIEQGYIKPWDHAKNLDKFRMRGLIDANTHAAYYSKTVGQ